MAGNRTTAEKVAENLAFLEATLAAQGEYATRVQNMYIDVKEYGALGDGTTDDRDAINDLITAVGTYNTILFFSSDTDQIYLGDRDTGGTYKISSDLTFPSNITLAFGQGATLSIDTGITVTVNGDINTLFKESDIFTGLGTYVYNGENRLDFLELRDGPYETTTTTDSHTADSGNYLYGVVSALAEDMLINEPGGTHTRFKTYVYYIKDNGTQRNLTYDSNIGTMGANKPSTTIVGKWVAIGLIYNPVADKWFVMAVGFED